MRTVLIIDKHLTLLVPSIVPCLALIGYEGDEDVVETGEALEACNLLGPPAIAMEDVGSCGTGFDLLSEKGGGLPVVGAIRVCDEARPVLGVVVVRFRNSVPVAPDRPRYGPGEDVRGRCRSNVREENRLCKYQGWLNFEYCFRAL